jgi:hypothetical protein
VKFYFASLNTVVHSAEEKFTKFHQTSTNLLYVEHPQLALLNIGIKFEKLIQSEKTAAFWLTIGC